MKTFGADHLSRNSWSSLVPNIERVSHLQKGSDTIPIISLLQEHTKISYALGERLNNRSDQYFDPITLLSLINGSTLTK